MSKQPSKQLAKAECEEICLGIRIRTLGEVHFCFERTRESSLLKLSSSLRSPAILSVHVSFRG